MVLAQRVGYGLATRLAGKRAAATVATRPTMKAMARTEGTTRMSAVYPILALGGGGMGMPMAEIPNARAVPTTTPTALPAAPKRRFSGKHQFEHSQPVVAQRHHRSKLTGPLEYAHVDAVADAQQYHYEDDRLQDAGTGARRAQRYCYRSR